MSPAFYMKAVIFSYSRTLSSSPVLLFLFWTVPNFVVWHNYAYCVYTIFFLKVRLLNMWSIALIHCIYNFYPSIQFHCSHIIIAKHLFMKIMHWILLYSNAKYIIWVSHQNSSIQQTFNECLLGVLILKRDLEGKKAQNKLPEDTDFQF